MIMPTTIRRMFTDRCLVAIAISLFVLRATVGLSSSLVPIQLEGISSISLSLDISMPTRPDEQSVRRLQRGERLLAQYLERAATPIRQDSADGVSVKIVVIAVPGGYSLAGYAGVVRPGLVKIGEKLYRQFPVTVWSDTYVTTVREKDLDEGIMDSLRYFGEEISTSVSGVRKRHDAGTPP